MIARLRIVEGTAQPSDQRQRIQAIIGSWETALTIDNATETTIEGDTALEGQATDGRGGVWQFLLFPDPELRIGVVHNNSHTTEEVLAELARHKDEAELQAIGARCL